MCFMTCSYFFWTVAQSVDINFWYHKKSFFHCVLRLLICNSLSLIPTVLNGVKIWAVWKYGELCMAKLGYVT